MISTPFINRLRTSGGTFYTFSSSVQDIQKTFGDDSARFVFSKMALLELPKVDYNTDVNVANVIDWTLAGATGTTTKSESVNLSESFQNWLLNWETLILNGKNDLGQAYQIGDFNTPTERLFWRWLAQLGAINFRFATSNESFNNNFLVETKDSNGYNTVVKWIGDIDVVNNVQSNGQAYSEVFLNVPTEHGSTPVILWEPKSDPNYQPGVSWESSNNDFIEGRNSGSVHPSGLSINAFYENDATNSYTTRNMFGNPDLIVATSTGGGTSYISGVDGICLNWEIEQVRLSENYNWQTFSESNVSDLSSDFAFNTVLVYYDIYSVENPGVFQRNLYGVLFLDDFDETPGIEKLKTYTKFKPNPVTKTNGNSFSFKFRIRFDTSTDQAGVETFINEYSTFSMDLFVDASRRMQDAAEMFLNHSLEIIDIKNRLSSLEQFYFSTDQFGDLLNRLTNLERGLNDAKLVWNSSTGLLDLINRINDNVNSILNGKINSNLTFDLSPFVAGLGINIEKNSEKLIVSTQGYGFDVLRIRDQTALTGILGNGLTNEIGKTNRIEIGKNSGIYYDISIGTIENPVLTDLYINLDDYANGWFNGKKVEVAFKNLNTNGYSLFIRTDSGNRWGLGTWGINIITLGPNDITPNISIETVCIDVLTGRFYTKIKK